MFTKEMIDDYADKLLIGLTDEECDMIQKEFDEVNRNMELINEIENIKEVVPLSYPFEMDAEELRSDDEISEEIPVEELLQNCDNYEGREVVVPKVVGE